MGAELPQPTYGTSAVVLPSPDDAASKLAHDQDTWAIQAGLISFLPYIAGILALMILAAIFLSTSKPVWAHKIAALTAVIPLILLLSTTLPIFGVLLAVAVAIALFFLRPADTSLFAAISVAIMVVVDCFVFGGKLTSGSMLGYCPIFGARYYGLGNEIMGAYIGALVVITAIWDAPGKFRAGLILMWAVVGFSLALPIAGAKAGGLIVCAVTIAAYIACGTGRKLTDWVSICRGRRSHRLEPFWPRDPCWKHYGPGKNGRNGNNIQYYRTQSRYGYSSCFSQCVGLGACIKRIWQVSSAQHRRFGFSWHSSDFSLPFL
jgi:hypothetical protein